MMLMRAELALAIWKQQINEAVRIQSLSARYSVNQLNPRMTWIGTRLYQAIAEASELCTSGLNNLTYNSEGLSKLPPVIVKPNTRLGQQPATASGLTSRVCIDSIMERRGQSNSTERDHNAMPMPHLAQSQGHPNSLTFIGDSIQGMHLTLRSDRHLESEDKTVEDVASRRNTQRQLLMHLRARLRHNRSKSLCSGYTQPDHFNQCDHLDGLSKQSMLKLDGSINTSFEEKKKEAERLERASNQFGKDIQALSAFTILKTCMSRMDSEQLQELKELIFIPGFPELNAIEHQLFLAALLDTLLNLTQTMNRNESERERNRSAKELRRDKELEIKRMSKLVTVEQKTETIPLYDLYDALLTFPWSDFMVLGRVLVRSNKLWELLEMRLQQAPQVPEETDPDPIHRINHLPRGAQQYLWPVHQLEDLSCMNRFWFGTTDQNSPSRLRIRMYPSTPR